VLLPPVFPALCCHLAEIGSNKYLAKPAHVAALYAGANCVRIFIGWLL